jgi:hypothetical protein
MARAFLLAALLALYPLHSALAADPPSCDVAGADAERDWKLPPGLLAAIGRIESGRYDPAAGRVSAWPFTINAAGEGHYFDSSAAAIEAVQDLVMRGVQSIDVGCFQINLMYHPDAFATLDQAFDVRANAQYAARFLSDLHDRTGSWEAAIAWYHSATPSEGEPYRSRVMADWQGGGLRIAAAIPASWAVPARGPADPVVVLVSTAAQRVRVFTPVAYTTAAYTTGAATDAFAPLRRWSAPGKLPRIITPRG